MPEYNSLNKVNDNKQAERASMDDEAARQRSMEECRTVFWKQGAIGAVTYATVGTASMFILPRLCMYSLLQLSALA